MCLSLFYWNSMNSPMKGDSGQNFTNFKTGRVLRFLLFFASIKSLIPKRHTYLLTYSSTTFLRSNLFRANVLKPFTLQIWFDSIFSPYLTFSFHLDVHSGFLDVHVLPKRNRLQNRRCSFNRIVEFRNLVICCFTAISTDRPINPNFLLICLFS